jgi:ribosomal protein L21
MYAIVETAGFQYKVALGDRLNLPSMEAEVGSEVEIKSVLLFANGEEVKVGTPVVAGISVKVEVLAHDRAAKVKVFKKKRRQGYRKTQGHRQGYSEVIVTELNGEKVSEDLIKKSRQRRLVMAAAKEVTPRLTKKEKIAKAQA